jgi:hypothetical protein
VIREIQGYLVLNPVGLGLSLLLLGLAFSLPASALTWFVARGHYRTPAPRRVRPSQARRQARRTPQIIAHAAGWPLYEPGRYAVTPATATTRRLPRFVDLQPRTAERSPW